MLNHCSRLTARSCNIRYCCSSSKVIFGIIFQTRFSFPADVGYDQVSREARDLISK